MIADVYMHADLPALIRIFGSDFKSVEHAIAVNDEDEIILDAQIQKMYYVVDLYDLKISPDEMIKGAGLVVHPFKNFRHRNVIDILVIVPDHLYEETLQAFTSSILSDLPLKISNSMEEAIEYMESQHEVAPWSRFAS
jgi:hypothetical protein